MLCLIFLNCPNFTHFNIFAFSCLLIMVSIRQFLCLLYRNSENVGDFVFFLIHKFKCFNRQPMYKKFKQLLSHYDFSIILFIVHSNMFLLKECINLYIILIHYWDGYWHIYLWTFYKSMTARIFSQRYSHFFLTLEEQKLKKKYWVIFMVHIIVKEEEALVK